MIDKRVIGGSLIVAGTTVGAAMLALPISTGTVGFIPSVELFIGFWALMTFSAFLFLEVTLFMKKDTNIVSMAAHTLGRPGQVIAWTVYLFLLYALLTAYTAVSAPLIGDLARGIGFEIPTFLTPLPLLVVFGSFVYGGTMWVDRMNRVLMLGLGAAFFFVIFIAVDDIQLDLLMRTEWSAWPGALAVISTAFGFHIVIPSLANYLDRDVKKLKQTLLIGTSIPLVAYLIWNGIALGVIPPEGPHSIASAIENGEPATNPLRYLLSNPQIGIAARVVDLCAILTSFLGVSLSLSHFFADGLGIKKTAWGRILTWILTFVPPVVIVLTNPKVFLTALEYAGVYGVIGLLALLPACMAYRCRKMNSKSPYTAPGGTIAIICVIVITLSLIALETARQFGILS